MGDLDNILFTKEYFLQDNICRFCWTTDATIDCTLKSPLFFKVEYCLNIDLSQDDTVYSPKKVCETCFAKIEQFHDFKTFCHNANEQLIEILNSNLDTSTYCESQEEIKLEKVESTAINELPFDSQQSLYNVASQNHQSSTIKEEKHPIHYPPKNEVSNKSTKNLQIRKSVFGTKRKRTITKSIIANVIPTPSGYDDSSRENTDIDEYEDTILKHKRKTTRGVQKEDIKSEYVICKEHAQKSTDTIKNKLKSPTYCKSCCEDFHNEHSFIKHKNDAHGIEKDGKYRCFGCNKLFLQRVSRLCHEAQKCTQLVNGYKCTTCNKYLPTRGVYEKHMKNHRLNIKQELLNNEIFKCEKCAEQFPNRRGLVLHMKRYGHNKKKSDEKIPKTSSTYCRRCNEQFPDEDSFVKHKSEAHGIEKDGRYRCFGCGKLFINRVSCLGHESKVCSQLVDGYKCSICNTLAQTRSTYEKHMTNHRQNRTVQEPTQHTFKCFKCGEEFTKKSEYHAHSKLHYIRKEYVCETCGKEFSNFTYLKMHRYTHTGERKYECGHCGYKCTQKNNLTVHIRKHTKERPYACDLCPARTVTRGSLLRHRQSHLGLKPYECPYDDCDKKFAHPGSLKEHVAIKHEGTASNPCVVCGQDFLRKGHLRRHLQKKHPNEAKAIIKKTPGRAPDYDVELPQAL